MKLKKSTSKNLNLILLGVTIVILIIGAGSQIFSNEMIPVFTSILSLILMIGFSIFIIYKLNKTLKSKKETEK